MTDEQPVEPQKPKRRRWRWLVMGLLLFAVSVAGWWNWPRGDARFVGTWDVPDIHREGGATILTLRMNGTGITCGPRGNTAYYWRVHENNLILGKKMPALLDRGVRWVADQMYWYTDTDFSMDEETIEILELTPMSIRCRFPDDGSLEERVLTRLPE